MKKFIRKVATIEDRFVEGLFDKNWPVRFIPGIEFVIVHHHVWKYESSRILYGFAAVSETLKGTAYGLVAYSLYKAGETLLK